MGEKINSVTICDSSDKRFLNHHADEKSVNKTYVQTSNVHLISVIDLEIGGKFVDATFCN